MRRRNVQTIINADAPSDILTRDVPKVEFEAVEGLAAESMETSQREILMNLVHEYIDRLPDEVAQIELRKLREGNVNDIHFAWAGGETPKTPHYYRLHGPFFFVEYDNTQEQCEPHTFRVAAHRRRFWCRSASVALPQIRPPRSLSLSS